MLARLQSKGKIAEEQIERPRGQHGPGKLLTKFTFAGKLIMRQHDLLVLRRLVTNPEDVENLSMMPRQFGSESLQLHPRQLLLLPMSTLEI